MCTLKTNLDICGLKVGYPASTNDATIAQQMPVLDDVQSYMHEDCWSAADQGFKEQPKVIRPKRNVPEHLRQANKDARSARSEIERTFGQIFHNLFSRVNVWKGYKLELWTKACVTACLLYNVKVLLDYCVDP